MSIIKYLGIIIDQNGRRPDPEKVKAIKEMPSPTNVRTIKSFLSMINYYHQFIAELYNLRAPLNRLLTKDTKWCWSEACQNSFQKIKDIHLSDLSLTH